MTHVYILLQYENYGFEEDYKPYKKAFLSREGVVDFLKEIAFNEIKGEQRAQQLSQIEKDLSLNLHRHYGDYRYETETIPIFSSIVQASRNSG